MKKTLLLCSILVMISVFGISQTAASVANGNWMNPFTWNCTCVPLPGYSVTINHAVALDTSWYVPSGGITINASGSLIKNNPTRDLLVNGGILDNKGVLDVRYLFTQTGVFSNSGTLTARSFLNYINFTNTGTIQNIDSLYSTGAIINNGSFLNIDSITTGGIFTNNGVCTYNQFTNTGIYTNNNNLTFTDITNLGTFNNADTMTALNSGWNVETWNNLAGGYFLVNNGFLNADSVQNNATFTNDGRMVVNDSWYNADTVKGTASGSIRVADTSINWGWMKGNFDFCDLTPPASPPYVDFNFGTISSGITWCLFNGVSEIQKEEINIYPNPSFDLFFIDLEGKNISEIKIYNTSGGLIKGNKNLNWIDVSEFSSGLYFISVKTNENVYLQKIQILK